jgi:hypothetical protein
MNYQTVAQKVSEFITFKAQIHKMQTEIEDLEQSPPKVQSDVLTWDEAVAFAENQKQHQERIEKLYMGVASRREIIQNKEHEIGEMLPVKDLYILFKITIDGEEQTYKIGYFPKSYGFRLEKLAENIQENVAENPSQK